MKVKELIDKLSEFPPKMDVLVDGYEDGYDPISSVSQISVVQQENFDWYNGEFDEAKTGTHGANQVIIIKRPHRMEGAKK